MGNEVFRFLLTDKIPYDEALALWACCTRRDVFNHPGCWRALVESGVHAGQMVCVEVRASNGALTAVWPFIIKRGSAKDMFARIVEPLGTHYVDYILPIVSQHGDQRVLASLLEGVANILSSTGRMRLPKLFQGTEYVNAAESAFVSHRNMHSSPCLRFGKSYAETEADLGWRKKHRPSVRLRQIRKNNDFSLWVAEDKSHIIERLPTLYNLHQKKWASQGKSSQFDCLSEQKCFHLFVQYLPKDMLHFSEVRMNENVVSCHFGFLSNDWLYWYKPAYDPSYHNFSPGVLHIALLAQNGINRGWVGIDFLQGDEQYKFRWENDSTKTIDLTLATKSGLPWWLWETRFREGIRKTYLNLRYQ